jgi:aryl-alcohol dehydrogenase-like predicted oxidoreductase
MRGHRGGWRLCPPWLVRRGATANQVVLAWLMGGELPVIPLVGVSSVAQLEESLGAVDLTLATEQRERLDQAG